MRIVSLLPSATEIVFALGLGEELVGVTHECDYPSEARDVPRVTRAIRDPDRAAAHVLHRLVEGSAQAGTTIIALDERALLDARPDLILTRALCRTCATGYREIAELVKRLPGEVSVVDLEPRSVEGVINSIQTIGAMTETEDEAVAIVEDLRERLQAVEQIVVGRRDHGFIPPRAAAIGWLEPPFAVGGWIPEQVRLAGGWELLGRDGDRAAETNWAAIREVDPEVVVLMPAAHDLNAVIEAWERTPRPAGWDEIRAIRDGRVFAVDAAGYFSRPGPRVVDGIEVLAELFDPIAFDGMSPPGSWIKVG